MSAAVPVCRLMSCFRQVVPGCAAESNLAESICQAVMMVETGVHESHMLGILPKTDMFWTIKLMTMPGFCREQKPIRETCLYRVGQGWMR